MPTPDLMTTGSDGALCTIVSKILNNPKNMKLMIKMLKEPETKNQARLALKVYKYAGRSARSVPQAIFDTAGLADFPSLADDHRTMYAGTPPTSDKTIAEQFVDQLIIPPDENGEAKLSSPQGRVAVSDQAKALNIRAGRVRALSDEAQTRLELEAELEDERNANQNLEQRIQALETELEEQRAWQTVAQAKHEALIMWMTYAVAPNDDVSPRPNINTHIDAPIQFPPLEDPAGDEGTYGGTKPADQTYTGTPSKRRRVNYYTTPPAAV